MPLQATSGAASQDAFGGNGVAVVPTYIEEVFSTYLYTGTGASRTIVNGIDLATKGGMIWIKDRTTATNHNIEDTVQGITKNLAPNTTAAAATVASGDDITSFTTTGWTFGNNNLNINNSGDAFASWTFRKQPKFFDVVTFTGNGTAGRTISHNLGSVPGCIFVKTTSNVKNWAVWHRAANSGNAYAYLNTTDAFNNNGGAFFGTGPFGSYVAPTLTNFTVSDGDEVNKNGWTYIAYIFAHDAGGFGLTGTDNVISCGSFTTDGSGNATVSLGYEPQWVLRKSSSNNGYPWYIMDNMRGYSTPSGSTSYLSPNDATAEVSYVNLDGITSTGFKVIGQAAGVAFIYIAIRRGPMKVPTTGTSVFSPNAYTGTGAVLPITGMGFPPDFLLTKYRTGGNDWCAQDKLRGPSQYLTTDGTGAELNLGTAQLVSIDQNGVTYGNGSSLTNFNGAPYINLSFRRAPSFFDEVCYTGTGSALTVSHNLTAVPELIIGKNRTTAGNNWPVLFNFASTTMNYGFLNLTNSCPNDTYANVGVFSATPTSTSMSLLSSGSMNTSANNHVAYLFSTCAGVSKVFSYTGNGSSQTINCGFTGGARWVMIKRTDSTGDWYVWDSARGIVAGNDPHLSLNSTAAEVTTDDSVDTDNTGFIVNQVAATNVNVSSATYIGIAIA